MTGPATARRIVRVLPAALCMALALHHAMAISARLPEPMLYGQTRQEYAARRAAVREAARDAIVLISGEPDPGDIERVRFRTFNDLFYLTGVETPDATLALLPPGDPSGKTEILFLPPFEPGMAQWVDPLAGPGPDTERATGIAMVRSTKEMWELLKPSIQSGRRFILGGPPDGKGRSPSRDALAKGIRDINTAATIDGTTDRMIHPLRRTKSPGEILNIRKAIACTGEGEKRAAQTIRAGAAEIAVEGAILEAYRRTGAPREAFPCIVGSGPNSTVLHHYAGDRIMRQGEVVVVDIGAEYNYYAADITRTFPCGGRFSPRQRELYQLVLDVQTACQKYVKPGKTSMRDLDGYARQLLRASPLRARDSSGALRTMDAFMPHGLGHSMGLDVHDLGGLGSMEPGTVFTIEPGVYIAGEGIGIRIEDDYLVTATGAEKLSAAIPSKVTEIESMMRPAAKGAGTANR